MRLPIKNLVVEYTLCLHVYIVEVHTSEYTFPQMLITICKLSATKKAKSKYRVITCVLPSSNYRCNTYSCIARYNGTVVHLS